MKRRGRYQIWLILAISCIFVILPYSGYGAGLTIGNTITMTGIDGVEISAGSPVYVNGSGQLGTETSSGTFSVNCSAVPTPESLQSAVNAAQPGDTINVTGTCNENVTILEEKQRLTLNGQDSTTLNGNSSSWTLNIKGTGIVIRNFTVTGGFGGIFVYRNGSAVITDNNIHHTGGTGVLIQSAVGVVRNNNIHDNPGSGIAVDSGGSARIGFNFVTDPSAPNTIQNNAGRGIELDRSSNARIAGNTITGNGNDGIGVFRSSQVDISGNTIDNNGSGVTPVGHGINVAHNGGIHLGEFDASTYLGQPNITTNNTTANNAGYGIRCQMGSYVRAYHFVQTYDATHPIWGVSGQHNIDANCPSALTNP